MTKTDFSKFLALMNGIGEYYGKNLSPVILDLYWDGLKSFDFEAVSHAVHQHMANPDSGQFFPKIADVVRHIGGGNADRALVAWAKVDKAVRTVGNYRSIVFDDAIIHAIIADMGGWIGFGSGDIEEWPFRQNEFVKRYRGYLERGGAGKDYPAKLIGQADMHNRQLGLNDTGRETVLLGDHSKAMDVLRLGSDSGKKNQPVLLEDHVKRGGGLVKLGVVK